VHKLYRKAASIGLDPTGGGAVHETLAESARALRSAGLDPAYAEKVLGELLAAAVASARCYGIDAESALRAWAGRYRDRFAAMEGIAASRGVELASADSATVMALWGEAGNDVDDEPLGDRAGL